MKRIAVAAVLALTGLSLACERSPAPTEVDADAELARAGGRAPVGFNVVLDRPATPPVLDELGRHGRVTGQIEEIDAVFMAADEAALDAIRALPFVEAAGLDARRTTGPPRPPLPVEDFANGLNTWDLDAVNVTDLGAGRTAGFDGDGVYVGVLDTGLMDSWRHYFPEERIATEHARSYSGGGALGGGAVSSQPNKWEHDTSGHGTHVTSTILGYNLGAPGSVFPINGVAPKATVIPVKVLNQNGSGWSSVIARGIMHIAELKEGPLADHPVVVNMSLGGPVLDAVEKAAIDYARSQGVIVVAAAGNFGEQGMAFPAAYEPVISVGASGWIGEWIPDRSWWLTQDVPDPTDPDDFYVTGFSSRALPGQDLDVLAPGSWVVGPFQLDRGHISYFFLGGTSMASPHVAGIVALMAQKNGSLGTMGGPDPETILQNSAVPLPPGSRTIATPSGASVTVSWGADATGHGLATADAALGLTP